MISDVLKRRPKHQNLDQRDIHVLLFNYDVRPPPTAAGELLLPASVVNRTQFPDSFGRVGLSNLRALREAQTRHGRYGLAKESIIDAVCPVHSGSPLSQTCLGRGAGGEGPAPLSIFSLGNATFLL